MKALILNNLIVQVVENDETFEVHPEMSWIDCPDETTTEWSYSDGNFISPKEVQISYDIHRKYNYPSIQDQLDILFHEGYDGWKKAIQEVKLKYPKPEVN